MQVRSVNSTSLAVSWQQSTLTSESSSGYEVTWWKDSEGANTSTTVLVSGNTREFIITGLKPHESYVVQVARVDSTRNVTLDVVKAEGHSRTDPEPGPQPTGVSVSTAQTNSSSSHVVVKWNPADVGTDSAVEGYIVTICPVEQVGGDKEVNRSCQIINTSSQDTQVVLDGLQQFEDYEVEIKSFVTNGGKRVEGRATRTVITTSPPPVPTVAGLQITSLNSSSSTVSWTRPEGLHNFIIVYNVTVYLTDDKSVVLWREVNETQTILTGLSEWTNYTIRVYVCLARVGKRHCGDFSATHFETTPKGKFALQLYSS